MLNLIPTNTLKVAGIPLSRIAGAPIEVLGFAGIHECTIGNIQLVLKVGPIVALTIFHVIDSLVSYNTLLGNPIYIPTNPTPFDISEVHYFEATFYDELTQSGEDSTSRPVGILLPSWQDIENNL